MTKIITAWAFIFIVLGTNGQNKRIIDTSVLKTWPSLMLDENGIKLSDDGHYVAYLTLNSPINSTTMTIKDLRRKWATTTKCRIAKLIFFSADSRRLCWQRGDSILLQKIENNESHLLGLSNEISFPNNKRGKWILIRLKNIKSGFKLVNIITGSEQILNSVTNHSWAADGETLIVTTEDGNSKYMNLANNKSFIFPAVNFMISPNQKELVYHTLDNKRYSIRLISIEKAATFTIWQGKEEEQPSHYIFDRSSEQLAFTTTRPGDEIKIWYYKIGQPKALRLIENKGECLKGLNISDITTFSNNGSWLFFTVENPIAPLKKETTVSSVGIWSYRDEIIYPAQNRSSRPSKTRAAVIEIISNDIQILENDDDETVSFLGDDCVLLEKGGSKSTSNYWWPHNSPKSFWILSLSQKSKRLLKKGANQIANQLLFIPSPKGKWVIYWDCELGHYFSYNTKSGQSINLTTHISSSTANELEQRTELRPVGIAGWYQNDEALLLYDNFDIWKIDPSGGQKPINITGGFGAKRGIKLRLLDKYKENIQPGIEEYLIGFDIHSKYNGFLSIKIDAPKSILQLTMGPYTYYQTINDQHSFIPAFKPISCGKGKNKRWIVLRHSDIEYPNLFYSKDLKSFSPLTNLAPQRIFNWLTAEPIEYITLSGTASSGVLYKPENFDPQIKYPIIFNYYEKLSHRCYQFPLPDLTKSNINIPWFVSRGYLVFTPDIQYTVANSPSGMTVTEAAYNSVSAAAEYLSQKPYIDKSKMAIQGHSFGGQQTVGIITKSSLFAAAAEVAGTMDNISAYLTLVTLDESNPVEFFSKQDHPQARMGASPWERPDLYRRNSPVLNADKINTPLMIVHNPKDGSISFRQGVEIYMALRRLGKPCWMLQYDNSGHIIEDDNDALDYTIRLQQYFDHYLKGEPAPLWMTMNTFSQYKGNNNLYELDSTRSCIKGCTICQKWKTKSTRSQQQQEY